MAGVVEDLVLVMRNQHGYRSGNAQSLVPGQLIINLGDKFAHNDAGGLIGIDIGIHRVFNGGLDGQVFGLSGGLVLHKNIVFGLKHLLGEFDAGQNLRPVFGAEAALGFAEVLEIQEQVILPVHDLEFRAGLKTFSTEGDLVTANLFIGSGNINVIQLDAVEIFFGYDGVFVLGQGNSLLHHGEKHEGFLVFSRIS